MELGFISGGTELYFMFRLYDEDGTKHAALYDTGSAGESLDLKIKRYSHFLTDYH